MESDSIDFMVKFQASVEANTAELARARKRAERLSNNLWQLNPGAIPIPLSGGAGLLDQPNLLGPRTGQVWSIHRIGLWGMTGTSNVINIFLDNVGGDQVATVTGAGSLFYGKAQLLLTPGHRLVFQASSITGVAQVGIYGVQMAEPLLSEYLI
jgi:hypothetical protein